MNTGLVSVGELLMTFRISAVAACSFQRLCDSALRAWKSFEQPHVFDGDHSLSAKVLRRLIVLLVHGPVVARVTVNRKPIAVCLLATLGTIITPKPLCPALSLPLRHVRFRFDIANLKNVSLSTARAISYRSVIARERAHVLPDSPILVTAEQVNHPFYDPSNRGRETAEEAPKGSRSRRIPVACRRRTADNLENLRVAVCRSSASLVSLNSRTFSIAITAWSAKVLIRSICFCVNARTSRRLIAIAPTKRPFLEHGHSKGAYMYVLRPVRLSQRPSDLLPGKGVSLSVQDVCGLLFGDHSASRTRGRRCVSGSRPPIWRTLVFPQSN